MTRSCAFSHQIKIVNNDPPLQLRTMTPGSEPMFPTFKPEQIDRAAAHGHFRQVQGGEILVEAGERNVPFFIVKTGHVAIIRRSPTVSASMRLLQPRSMARR